MENINANANTNADACPAIKNNGMRCKNKVFKYGACKVHKGYMCTGDDDPRIRDFVSELYEIVSLYIPYANMLDNNHIDYTAPYKGNLCNILELDEDINAIILPAVRGLEGMRSIMTKYRDMGCNYSLLTNLYHTISFHVQSKTIVVPLDNIYELCLPYVLKVISSE